MLQTFQGLNCKHIRMDTLPWTSLILCISHTVISGSHFKHVVRCITYIKLAQAMKVCVNVCARLHPIWILNINPVLNRWMNENQWYQIKDIQNGFIKSAMKVEIVIPDFFFKRLQFLRVYSSGQRYLNSTTKQILTTIQCSLRSTAFKFMDTPDKCKDNTINCWVSHKKEESNV